MELTIAGRVVLVLAALALIFVLIGVAGRVASGQWPAEQVIAVAVAVPTLLLILFMAWRWAR